VFTYIGGPTLLVEIGRVRFLTDPTFDPAGAHYTVGPVKLAKTTGPAAAADALPAVDAVLLSHDQHVDNLDDTGRAFLKRAATVLTTVAGADRLGGHAVGLTPWASRVVRSADGTEAVTVTATPARHGPAGCEPLQGEVVGFCLEWASADGAIYVSGDTVWYDGVAEVARRFRVSTAVLFLGAAVIPAKGRAPLTMTAEEAVLAARALTPKHVLPIHYEGWAHLSQGKEEVAGAFAAAGLSEKLVWLRSGRPTSLE
jgi:L-ascorbate metabolism protein UlaG (beta-lactamase superfamily)